ncbi:DMT family transporter [Rhodoferax sp. GW822-FHT02A01]|uniref:DMT family transporter n=1 Tax=Rhodoferax sp. GW822-FHT02A01 TaxID=3141537 RepID=UPI00315C9E7D
MTSTAQGRAKLLLWVSPAFISSNYILAKAASGEIAPHLMALIRWSVALCLMGAFSWRQLGQLMRLPAREYLHVLVLGGLGMWICGAFVYEAAFSTSSTNIALIYAVTPVAIAAVNSGASGGTVLPRHWVGMLLALFGVLFVISKGHLGNLSATRLVVGDVWVVVAATAWVAYTLLTQRWPSALDTSTRLCAVTCAGVLILLPCTVIEALHAGQVLLTRRGLLLAAVAGVIPGFVAYKSYAFLIQKLGPAQAGLVMYLSPVYAAAIAWVLLGEAPSWFHFAGAAMILPSIYLVTSQNTRSTEAGR